MFVNVSHNEERQLRAYMVGSVPVDDGDGE
jgi:hypothetical protein